MTQLYGVSLAIWDHTVLPSIRHKWIHPALTLASLFVCFVASIWLRRWSCMVHVFYVCTCIAT